MLTTLLVSAASLLFTASLLLAAAPGASAYRHYQTLRIGSKLCNPPTQVNNNGSSNDWFTLQLEPQGGSISYYVTVKRGGDDGLVDPTSAPALSPPSVPPTRAERCRFRVDAGWEFGVLATVQKVALTPGDNATCREHVKFSSHDLQSVSDELCGYKDETQNSPLWKHSYSVSGPMDVDIITEIPEPNGNATKKLDSVVMKITFVAFLRCPAGLGIWKRCPDSDVCLHPALFCDGVRNCPTNEEPFCRYNIQPSGPATEKPKVPDDYHEEIRKEPAKGGMAWPLLVFLIAIPISLVVLIGGAIAHFTNGKCSCHGTDRNNHTRGSSHLEPTFEPFVPCEASAPPFENHGTVINIRNLNVHFNANHGRQGHNARQCDAILPPSYETLFPSH